MVADVTNYIWDMLNSFRIEIIYYQLPDVLLNLVNINNLVVFEFSRRQCPWNSKTVEIGNHDGKTIQYSFYITPKIYILYRTEHSDDAHAPYIYEYCTCESKLMFLLSFKGD